MVLYSLPIYQVESQLPRSEKLKGMVRQGIPHSLRPQIWMRMSGALEKKLKSELTYKDVVKASANDHLMTSKQIEKVSNIKIFFHTFTTRDIIVNLS